MCATHSQSENERSISDSHSGQTLSTAHDARTMHAHAHGAPTAAAYAVHHYPAPLILYQARAPRGSGRGCVP